MNWFGVPSVAAGFGAGVSCDGSQAGEGGNFEKIAAIHDEAPWVNR
jgi:hypothetical protein